MYKCQETRVPNRWGASQLLSRLFLELALIKRALTSLPLNPLAEALLGFSVGKFHPDTSRSSSAPVSTSELRLMGGQRTESFLD